VVIAQTMRSSKFGGKLKKCQKLWMKKHDDEIEIIFVADDLKIRTFLTHHTV